MFGFKEMSEIVSEFGNCAAGISGAYETPAKAAKDSATLNGDKIEDTGSPDLNDKKSTSTDWAAMNKKMRARRGE